MREAYSPFLTLEDPNAQVKGSRDPLGQVPIWSAFGRHVVTNVTSVCTSVRGFTILMLGKYFASRLIDEGMIPREDTLDVVLRTEQVGAYARYAGHGVESDIRGIERVKRFHEEGRGRVAIQSDRRGLILADQKVYGLWGLYSVSARRSGFIPDTPYGVTPLAQRFIEENYLPHLDATLPSTMRLLARGGVLDTKKSDSIFAAFVKVLPESFTAAEVGFYGHYLRDGLNGGVGAEDAATTEPSDGENSTQDTAHRQARFRKLLESDSDLESYVNRAEILHLAKAAREVDEGLSCLLHRIAQLEALLAPASALFSYVLTNHGQQPEDVARGLRKQWGESVPNLDPVAFDDLLAEVQTASSPAIGQAMKRCQAGLAAGDFTTAIRAVLDWNAKVMEGRKAGPWVVLADNGLLDVRYRETELMLPERDDLSTLWYNSYFIDVLKSLTRQLRNVR